ncbi:MAG: L,D-transpeptidase family protein [Syntrophobacterales bacterium]|jgi:murein L,D-transpeptidase YcbB/YkuD|nr:L,D-transpeptidase family protein [Syntrophobacterales bacterium]
MKQKTNLILLALGTCFILSGCIPVVEQTGNAVPVQDAVSSSGNQETPPLPPSKTSDISDKPVRAIIERKISHDMKAAPVLQGGKIIQKVKTLADFYSGQAWCPVWFKDGTPLPSATAFLEIIARAGDEGLSPLDYHYNIITNLLCPDEASSPLTDEIIADLDILLTDACQSYASHLRWGKSGRGKEFAQSALQSDESPFLKNIPEGSQLKEIISGFVPVNHEYTRLRQVLIRYRQIETEGGWPVIQGKALSKGNKDLRVASLKKRLHLTGELEEIIPEHEDLFDTELEAAVRLFQKTQKLKETGIADTATLKLLNVSVTERIHQISMDLERWRWMPRNLDRYILVDIPDFSMRVIEDGKEVLRMKTIVGKVKNPTPIFSGRMTIIELNPTWNVPVSIIRKEIVPLTKKDPSYISRQRIKIYQDWRSNAKEISPDSIDWENVNPEKFSYRLVQDPGGHNSLGRVKFLFPNVHDIYMHDTPTRSLFKRTERAFSHGCVRLEHPVDLAEHLLKGNNNWDRQQIQKRIRSGQRTTIILRDPIPVYMTYFLVEIDDSGHPYFRKDLYGYNRPLEKEKKRK